MDIRIGTGYDVHKLVPGRRLVLCGVEVPYERGLLGHSDADVAVHALMDALLGALALGDIGHLFPDTDAEYKDADSMMLLRRVGELVCSKGYRVGNLDLTIVAQAPKLAPHIQKMRKNLAEVLQLSLDRTSVKATTTEGLGFSGRGEGIAAECVCLVVRE